MEDYTETYAEGGNPFSNMNYMKSRQYEDPQKKIPLATIQLMHSAKILSRVLTIAVIIVLLMYVIANINSVVLSAYRIQNLKKQIKDDAPQEDFIQYLGGSAKQIRGDRDGDVSLEEKALLSNQQALAVQNFISRERLTTPEDEMMQKMKK